MKPRTIKPETPVRLIISLCLLGLLLISGILYAIYYTQREIEDARMRGTITEKHFTPQPEQQITIGEGGLNVTETKGEYTFIVEVKSREGGAKEYTVYVDEERYEAHEIGDLFDVGPYLVRTPDTGEPGN